MNHFGVKGVERSPNPPPPPAQYFFYFHSFEKKNWTKLSFTRLLVQAVVEVVPTELLGLRLNLLLLVLLPFTADYPVDCVGFVNDRADHRRYLFLRVSPAGDQPATPEPGARLHGVWLCRCRHGSQRLHCHVPRHLDRTDVNTSANATNPSHVNLRKALKNF